MKKHIAIIAGTLAASLVSTLAAQEGNFHGSITTGFRFTDVNGYQPKYQELFDLNGGLRLLNLNFGGTAAEDSAFKKYFDSYSLSTSGWGGDPYSMTQFSIRKAHRYDLRVGLRQSHYYWNRNDTTDLPGGIHSLTNYHDWATVRKFANVNLAIHATNHLQFTFDFNRNTRDGVNGTTRTLDYFGSSSTWGGFARANPYYIVAPLQETSTRGTAGVDYSNGGWSLHYRLGYQRFEDSINANLAGAGERSINVDDVNTAKELATSAGWRDYRRLNTPVSEASYTGKPTRWFEMRGGYIFYRYAGPASQDIAFSGLARTATATVVAPYTITGSSTATVTEPNHVVDQGFTFKVKDWWNIQADYRYSRFSVESDGKFASVYNGTPASGTAESQWRLGTHTADIDMMFTPVSSLLVRTGVRFMKSDIENREDGVINPDRTKRIKSVWPVASFYWQPSKMISLRGDIEQINNGTSYTRVSPHLDKGGRIIARVRPTEKLYFDDAVVVRNRELLQSDYHGSVRSNAFTANYEFTEQATVFAGFSYDSLFATDFVNFLRGTVPFTNLTIRDQTVERIWQAGFRLRPMPRLSVSVAGNYVRATGVGEIAGEAPLYGPMKFPYATGSFDYAVPRIGRIGLQLQRTYYSEQIVSGNNFSANLLTVSWTRSFGK